MKGGRSDESLGKALFLEALKRCKSWHYPICEMIQSTAFELVSGEERRRRSKGGTGDGNKGWGEEEDELRLRRA